MKQFVINSNPDYIDKNADGYILLDECLVTKENEDILLHKSTYINKMFDAEEYCSAKILTNKLADRITEYYAICLNDIYGLDISFKELKYIIGIWIRSFLFDIYSKYLAILSIKSDDIYTVFGTQRTVLPNQREYGYSSRFELAYQMVVASILFEEMGLKTKEIDDLKLSNSQMQEKHKKIWKERIRLLRNNPSYLLTKIKDKFISEQLVDNEILVVESRMPKPMENDILKETGNTTFCDAWYFWKKMNPLISSHKEDKDMRLSLYERNWGDDEFEKIAYKAFVRLMPISFCEAFYDLFQEAKILTEKWNYKRIYHSAHITELFAMCCALMKEKGTVLIDIQHAALYGASEYMGYSEYEVWDYFITWGWSASNLPYRNIYTVAMSRVPLKQTRNLEESLKYLMIVGTPEVSDGGSGCYYNKYFEEQKQFISNLPTKILDNLWIRFKSSTVSGEEDKLRTWCKTNYNSIHFEYADEKTFTNSVSESEFIICDYYTSAHLESLMLGVPFLMFEAAKIVSITPSARKFFSNFEKAGIYKKGGLDLALELQKHDDLHQWLYGGDSQLLYRDYLNYLTNADENLVRLWSQEFIREGIEK